MTSDVKVIVVGGGAAGLAASVELERLGVSCQLVEAQSRLGGRVHSIADTGDVPFDRGAQMINADMAAVLEIAAEGDLHLSPVPSTGMDLCVLQDEVFPRGDLISADDLDDLLQGQITSWSSPKDVARSLWSMYQWWATPWEDLGEAKRGVKWVASGRKAPQGSLAAAIDRLLLCAEDDAVARTMINEQYGAQPEALNAAAIRSGIEAYGSERLDLEFHFPVGMGRIMDLLAAKLSRQPLLNAPVTRIVAKQRGVTVEAAGRSWQAAAAIIAAPPPVARKIEVLHQDADKLRHLLSAFEAGDMIKTTFVYDSAFWRAKGWSGRVTFVDPVGLEVIDSSFDTGARPQLTAFLGGSIARERASLSPLDRKQAVLRDLCKAFGEDASSPIWVHEAVWVDDRWSGGGFNAYVKRDHPSDAAQQLAAQMGPVRFASAELDDSFAGYVEGAIRSGRRVAAQVATALLERRP